MVRCFKYIVSLFCFTLISIQISYGQDNYPTPPENRNSLFYIQRSGNTNTIVYDAHVDAKNQIESSNPITVYWRRYDETGQIKALNFIERKFAYGISTKKLPNPNEYEFHLVSYAKKKMRLAMDQNGHPIALMYINGQAAILKKVFIKMDPGNMLSFTPDIKYVELFGKDPNNGKSIYEKINF